MQGWHQQLQPRQHAVNTNLHITASADVPSRTCRCTWSQCVRDSVSSAVQAGRRLTRHFCGEKGSPEQPSEQQMDREEAGPWLPCAGAGHQSTC